MRLLLRSLAKIFSGQTAVGLYDLDLDLLTAKRRWTGEGSVQVWAVSGGISLFRFALGVVGSHQICWGVGLACVSKGEPPRSAEGRGGRPSRRAARTRKSLLRGLGAGGVGRALLGVIGAPFWIGAGLLIEAMSPIGPFRASPSCLSRPVCFSFRPMSDSTRDADGSGGPFGCCHPNGPLALRSTGEGKQPAFPICFLVSGCLALLLRSGTHERGRRAVLLRFA